MRSNGVMQGERGDSVEKHFIGFYRMHLIKSLSGLLNQKAWRATRRLAHWAEYFILNFCSYSPKACVFFLSTLDCSGESWFNDFASPDNCVSSRMRKSPQSWVYPVLDVLSFWHNWIDLVNYGPFSSLFQANKPWLMGKGKKTWWTS